MEFIIKNSTFYPTLKKRVEDYFQQKKIAKTGNWKLYLKTGILLLSFGTLLLLPYLKNLTFNQHLFYYGLLGMVISFIGFGIAHDAVHGSFSKNDLVNKFFSYAFELVGVSHYFWDYKHNKTHHMFTNVNEIDDDIMTGSLFRFNKEQKWRWYHRLQWSYALIAYSALYFQWVYFKDFQKWWTKKVGTKTTIKKMDAVQIISIITSKAFHIFIFLILPSFFFPLSVVLLSYLILSSVCGITITIVFQLAHVQTKSSFPVINKVTGNIENDWAISQVETTANFETWNPLVTQCTGGLNFQVEHHLFPKISHVHYPAISKIVKETCKEYGIRYNNFKSFFGATIDHFYYLILMGKKPSIF